MTQGPQLALGWALALDPAPPTRRAPRFLGLGLAFG